MHPAQGRDTADVTEYPGHVRFVPIADITQNTTLHGLAAAT
jgi:hypothetical protein